MKNTKLLFFALLAAAALLFAAGCSDSSDDDTITASDLVGTTWSYSYTETYDNVEYTITVTLTFDDESTCTELITITPDNYSASSKIIYSYKVSGSTITLTYERGYWDGAPEGGFDYSTVDEEDLVFTYHGSYLSHGEACYYPQ